MGISKLTLCAANYFAASKNFANKGVKYVYRESKNIFANNTKIGKRLREGVHNAREAVKVNIEKIPDSAGNTLQKCREYLEHNAASSVQNLFHDKNFKNLFENYLKKVHNRFGNDKTVLNYINGITNEISAENLFQSIIEASGIGPVKFCQIISSNQNFMSKIKNPALKDAILRTRNNCSFSRTIEEAQDFLNKSFPHKNFKIKNEMSAGSVGAAYLVERPDGTTAVLKMLKKGADKEQLELEEKLMSRLIKELGFSSKELEEYRAILKNCYKGWKEELNFFKEFEYNKLLAKGARRYKVADITDISKNGSCIIMNKASGIQMNKLVSMLNDYKSAPDCFSAKYAKEICADPWLKDPEKVMKELPVTLMKTFDEQFMFMKKGGKSLMHGDPHTGNFFITVDKKGKLIPEFIDTGNCVSRTGVQIKNDISFLSNYLVGNSEGVARYFVEQCGYNRANKRMIIDKIAKEIQEKVFGKKHNIKKFSDVQGNILAILDKYGLSMSAENATAMKAQMQFFTAVSEAARLSGKSLDITAVIKDMPQAVYGMIKNGINPFSSVKDAVKFAYYNQKQAAGTAYQFAIREADNIIKNETVNTLV